jgi:glycosyltransferase involved in cell wall biosynthesis
MKISFENKNIIIILKSFTLGGAERQALHLANYLQNHKNCKVFLYSYLQPEKNEVFSGECIKYGLSDLYLVKNPLSASGKFKYFKRRFKIALFGWKLRKHKPDIIIPYLNPPSIISALCYKIAGAKTTFWHHRGPDYYRHDLLEKKAVQKMPFFIANSPDGKKELETTLNINKTKSSFVGNFSTINQINKKKEIEDLNEHEHKIVIGMVAHFRIQKSQDIVIEVFHEVLKKNKNIHLLLVGNIHDDENEQSTFGKVNTYIEKNNLNKDVTILHNRTSEEILPYLDIGILISIKEGMPNIVMEYMAYSLPIITTKHEGCISLLGKNYGYFIQNDSKEQIISKLEKLVKKKEERSRIGEINHKRLIENFTIDRYINDLTTIFNK